MTDRIIPLGLKTVHSPASAEGRIRALQLAAGDAIVPLGVAPLPSGPALHAQPKDAAWDWAVLRVADDPLFQRGELAIPRRVRQLLKRLDQEQVRFDELFIAHEVPKGALGQREFKPDEIASAILSTPIPHTKGHAALSAVLAGVVAAPVTAGKLVGGALLAVAEVAAGAVADPVIIGAITSGGGTNPGTPAAYFLVARW